MRIFFIVAVLVVLASPAWATSELIQNAVAAPERLESDSKRDVRRKPAQILEILGAKPGMAVADLSSGGGYYTDILARIVGDEGKVIAHNAPYVVTRFADFFNDDENGWLARFKQPHWQESVEINTDELDNIRLPLHLDAAMMVLFYHDLVWQGVDRDRMNRYIFNALKPGGVFLIVDHSAKPGTGDQDVQTLHRIDKQFVIDEITRAGFVLDLDSDVLANPNDARDYNFVRDRQTNRDNTDRMVLRFIRPKG